MKETILLVEDDEPNRYLATFLLERNDYKILNARDGISAVRMALAEMPDLILLDIQLPLMDGYAVAQTLRRGGMLRDVPIIAVTSYAMVGDREKCLSAGCDGYIEKPINPQTFVSDVERYFKKPA